jgi:sec-independent protein translocase protein TatA
MGGMELLIILAVVLLFFGAKRLPELGRSLGSGIREFREGTAGSGEGQEELEERKQQDEKEPSLDRVAHVESPDAQAEVTTHTEQKT